MSKTEQLYEDIIAKWHQSKGVGSVYLSKDINYFPLVLGILERIFIKTKDANVIIVVSNFNERLDILNYLSNSDNGSEFKELINAKCIRAINVDLLDKILIKEPFLTISLAISEYEPQLANLFRQSKFKLACVTEHNNTINKLYEDVPLVFKFGENDSLMAYVNDCVEETRYPISISVEDRAKLNEYNKYIQNSCNIFGTFEKMERARNGDPRLNISAEQVRLSIAKDNGWSPNLNMTFPFNREIDELFNPNALAERLSTVYNIIRERSMLLSDNSAKLSVIVDIVKNNRDKKILIISKRKEFADEVTKAVNAEVLNFVISSKLDLFVKHDTDCVHPICYPYHNDLDSIPAVNEFNEPQYVKSGANKGKAKMMGAKARCSLYQKLFNENFISVLSTNNACDKDLECQIDMLIVTSSQCNDVKALKYRLSKVRFSSSPNIVNKLYVVDSIEERYLDKDVNEIVKNCETSNGGDDFNSIGIE